MSNQLIEAAQAIVLAHHSQYDSSHDHYHVNRVVRGSLVIAKSLQKEIAQQSDEGRGAETYVPHHSIDILVVHLAALFHDLIDSKYLPKGTRMTAFERLTDFWSEWSEEIISDERRRLVERIVENVSYSKEIKRIKNGEQTEWHETCLELHSVQDADKLDAIGAFGILRCAAYSGASDVPLFVPPTTLVSTVVETIPATSSKSSAIDHFSEKLINLEEMMRTPRGKTLAVERTKFLKTFMEQVDREWGEIEE